MWPTVTDKEAGKKKYPSHSLFFFFFFVPGGRNLGLATNIQERVSRDFAEFR